MGQFVVTFLLLALNEKSVNGLLLATREVGKPILPIRPTSPMKKVAEKTALKTGPKNKDDTKKALPKFDFSFLGNNKVLKEVPKNKGLNISSRNKKAMTTVTKNKKAPPKLKGTSSSTLSNKKKVSKVNLKAISGGEKITVNGRVFGMEKSFNVV